MSVSIKNCNDDDITGFTLWDSLTISEWRRIAVLLLVILGGSMYHHHSLLQLRRILGSNEVDILQKKLERTSMELESLRQKHEYLVERIQNLRRSVGPYIDYETARRKIQANTKELWLYISYYLTKALNESLLDVDQKLSILTEIAERKRSLLSDIEKLPTVDGYQKWRHNEAGSMGDLVQRRLRYLQNPSDCRQAKKLLCEVTTCGLGCQQHHLVYCLIYAYASGRTLLLRSYNWKNLAENKIQAQIFHRVSRTCNDLFNDTVRAWSAASLHAKVLVLPTLYLLKESVFPKYLPTYIPKDLAKRISRFNADPPSWWVGQMLKYILKPQREAQKIIHDNLLAIDFKSPTVGLHIRRTDKIQMEAKSHDIKEYMSHVEDYFAGIEQYREITERRVYLATDEPEVLAEAVALYPQYKFYINYTRVKWADLDSRMYPEAIMGTLVDIHMLAICDFVVCTFSSNIGRIVYELAQTYRLDAYTSFTSLDRCYYYTHGEPHYRVAVMHNTGSRSINFEVGDMITLENHEINSNGVVMRTHASGPFPWYKTVPFIPTHTFPKYKDVEIYADKRQP